MDDAIDPMRGARASLSLERNRRGFMIGSRRVLFLGFLSSFQWSCSAPNSRVVDLPDETDDTSEPVPCLGLEDCSEDEVCGGNEFCRGIWDGRYWIGVAAIRVPLQKTDGTAWDTDQSAPDVRCVFVYGGALAGGTEIHYDKYETEFPDREIMGLSADGLLEFSCIDSDDSGFEAIGEACWGASCVMNPAAGVRAGMTTLPLIQGEATDAEIDIVFQAE